MKDLYIWEARKRIRINQLINERFGWHAVTAPELSAEHHINRLWMTTTPLKTNFTQSSSLTSFPNLLAAAARLTLEWTTEEAESTREVPTTQSVATPSSCACFLAANVDGLSVIQPPTQHTWYLVRNGSFWSKNGDSSVPPSVDRRTLFALFDWTMGQTHRQTDGIRASETWKFSCPPKKNSKMMMEGDVCSCQVKLAAL